VTNNQYEIMKFHTIIDSHTAALALDMYIK